MSSTTITSLDRRLYAWLGESDDKKFERAFNAYFSVAYPAVVRHLMRTSRWDPALLEELAQDALLRFFEQVGRGRREASQAVQSALTCVRPLNFGPTHERQVNHWTQDVSSFRNSAMRFQLPEAEADDGNWKAVVNGFAERIPVLTQQGCHILNAVRAELCWECRDVPRAEMTPTDASERIACVSDEPIESDVIGRYAAAKAFANALATEATIRSARAQAALTVHPRVVEFANGTFAIIFALPRLRVPTNGYLFEISMTIYLDECKKRSRRKRGGGGRTAFMVNAIAPDDGSSVSERPSEMLTLGSDATAEETGLETTAIDPTPQYEQEDLFAKFYEHLQKPVAAAAQACANAAGTRRAAAASQKLESLTSKFVRTTEVLSLMGEGYTQEQIAEQLAISRNQVKYIVELVQQAYAGFIEPSTRRTASTVTLREMSHGH